MDLYILRHGIAEDRSPTGQDRGRALTDEGREKTRAASRALRKMDITFEAILASPFVRAWQTAEIVVEELGCQKLLRTCEALGCGGQLKEVFLELETLCGKHESALLVGHEPDLSRLISVLLSGAPELAITMKKGGLAKLYLEKAAPGAARLDWLLGPKHLSRMA